MPPKLSVVVVSRNDNHGGDLNHRTQIFINGISEQVRRTQLNTELIFVEWNPPKDRPPLKNTYEWPENNPYLSIRIITVPFEVHQTFKCHKGLALIQMEGKNVGIRRARGEYVLSTNVDLLFSNELFDFIASNKLHKGVMYRCDRIDVEKDVPLNANLAEQLKYCENHIIRINRRDGTWAPKQSNNLIDRSEKPKDGDRIRLLVWNLKNSIKQIFKKPQKAIHLYSLKLPFPLYLLASPLFILSDIFFIFSYHFIKASWKVIRHCRFVGFIVGVIRMRIFLKRANFSDYSWLKVLKLATVQDIIPKLHYNACGDFMLLDKESWLQFGSTPYYDGYSLHLDTLTMVNAYFNGIKFEELKSPLVAYHIEHGGGWTPESEINLFRAMNKRNVDILTWPDCLEFASKIKNGEIKPDSNWGWADQSLSESTVNTLGSKPMLEQSHLSNNPNR